MGKMLARHPLVNYKRVDGMSELPPVHFPSAAHGDRRPLAGIKVIELARVIAGPAMGAALASLGAEVIKVQSPELPDLQSLNLTLTAGKCTLSLNLNKPADCERLEQLIDGADVIIQAFRLRALERRGFGLQRALRAANRRKKGIVYVDLNCYGPDGYYAERPGFQQIADAASGCCYVCGIAYGNDDGVAVLPSLPIADMLCGAVGVIDVLLALRDRAMHGGSYNAHAALTAVDTIQLEPAFGLYSPDVVEEIQERYQFAKMSPDLMVEELLTIVLEAWGKTTELLARDDIFVTFDQSPFGNNHRILAPVVKFQNEEANPRWDLSPRPYCFDKVVGWTGASA